MPLPFIIGAAAAAAAAAGVGSGIKGAKKMKNAKDTMSLAQSTHEKNLDRFETKTNDANRVMDKLGELELNILKSFESFSNTIEQIHNRPEFKEYHKDGVELPSYNPEELKKVSVGAGVLLGGIGGAAAGTAGGFAAAGATTAAVMALGTASTGAAISSLSGIAAANATLAALGGGAIAAGGGGMALGTMVLGGATLGVGLLVGGIIFNATGGKLSQKADEAWLQVYKETEQVDRVCSYLDELMDTARDYTSSLKQVNRRYENAFEKLSETVRHKTDWNQFTEQEKINTQNAVLLVGLLYKMCQVNLVKQSDSSDEMNEVNTVEIEKALHDAERVLSDNP